MAAATVPNFLVIGAARSGTTALMEFLRQHPRIFVCAPKEPHFLAFAGAPVDFQGPGDDEVLNRAVVTDYDAYQRLFAGAGAGCAVGEGSVSTLYCHRRAIPNMDRHVPGVKAIAVLRDPIERAYSGFLYMRTRGLEPLHEFEQALDEEPARIDAKWQHMWHYTRLGLYSGQVRAFLGALGRERLKICLAEDLLSEPGRLLRELFAFLGVDENCPVDTSAQINRSGLPRSRALQGLFNRVTTWRGPVKRLLKPCVPMRLRQGMRNRNLSRPEMNRAARDRLSAFFRDDILKLQDLIGRDLGTWLG